MNKGRVFLVAAMLGLLSACVDGLTAPATDGCAGFSVADSLRAGSQASDSTFTITVGCTPAFR